MALRLGLGVLAALLVACSVPPTSLYLWQSTLDGRRIDPAQLRAAGVDQLGLRVFDWDRGRPVGPLRVVSPVPASVAVMPVAYVTTDQLQSWARDPSLDPKAEALRLKGAMDQGLGRAWPGQPQVWQLDADWTATTRDAWFAVVEAFAAEVHRAGGRLSATVRLHQYRDRATQGVPPADEGVLMLYGTGDRIVDEDLVTGYLKAADYPLPLVPAFPHYGQVLHKNGYGRLVGLFRVRSRDELPSTGLQPLGPNRWVVVQRLEFQGQVLLVHDTLDLDVVDPAVLLRVARQPVVQALRSRVGGRLWWFDWTPGEPLPSLDGSGSVRP